MTEHINLTIKAKFINIHGNNTKWLK